MTIAKHHWKYYFYPNEWKACSKFARITFSLHVWKLSESTSFELAHFWDFFQLVGEWRPLKKMASSPRKWYLTCLPSYKIKKFTILLLPGTRFYLTASVFHTQCLQIVLLSPWSVVFPTCQHWVDWVLASGITFISLMNRELVGICLAAASCCRIAQIWGSAAREESSLFPRLFWRISFRSLFNWGSGCCCCWFWSQEPGDIAPSALSSFPAPCLSREFPFPEPWKSCVACKTENTFSSTYFCHALVKICLQCSMYKLFPVSLRST